MENLWTKLIMVKYKNALIVDDDPVSNFICNLLLSKHQVAEQIKVTQDVDSGIQELEKIDQQGECRNLIFIDIKMPVKDGFKFMEEFNRRFNGLKERTDICVLTNSSSEDDFKRMQELGAKYWLNKPLKKENLNVIQELVMS